jgi:hypothetical protein
MNKLFGKSHRLFTLSVLLLIIGGLVSFLYSWVGFIMIMVAVLLLVWDRQKSIHANVQPLDTSGWKDTWLEQQNKKMNFIISRYRHDWMNEFQLLIGYVRLKKYDRMEEFVQKVIHRTKEESKLSILKDTSLILYLLGFNALYSELEIKTTVEAPVTGEGIDLTPNIKSLIMQIIESYRTHAIHNEFENNLLHMNIAWDLQRIVITFIYQGELEKTGWRTDWNMLKSSLDNSLANHFMIPDPSPSKLILEIPVESNYN